MKETFSSIEKARTYTDKKENRMFLIYKENSEWSSASHL
jgi:hypothetical protein